jgi:hypothetical protein
MSGEDINLWALVDGLSKKSAVSKKRRYLSVKHSVHDGISNDVKEPEK